MMLKGLVDEEETDDSDDETEDDTSVDCDEDKFDVTFTKRSVFLFRLDISIPAEVEVALFS
jgi:hypothetical protein